MIWSILFSGWCGRWQARRTVPAPGVITSSRFQLYSRDQVSGDELAIPALGGSSAMQVAGISRCFVRIGV